MQIWHLAGTRWSYIEHRFSESQGDLHVERGADGMRLQGDLQSLRDWRGGADLMTLVRGHHMLLWKQPTEIWMIYAVVFETVFWDVPEGMWICIQDEEFLE